MTRTRLFECSTLFGLATAAAVRERLEREAPAHNIVLLSANVRYPELDDPFADELGIAQRALAGFQSVVRLNDWIAPVHPQDFRFHVSWLGHRPMWLERLGVTHIDELVIESIQGPPALSLAQLFSEACIRVYGDGLMVYSPTRGPLPGSVVERVIEVHYVDLVPDVAPLLLNEARPSYRPISAEEIRPWFAVAAKQDERPLLVFLGQSLAYSRMMTDAEELALYRAGLEQLCRIAGDLTVAFKPHPAASSSVTRRLLKELKRAGKKVVLIEELEPVEVLLQRRRVLLFAGVFSTALFTAQRLYGIPAFTTGILPCLSALPETANSNRVPLVAADLLLPTLDELEQALRPGQPLSDAAQGCRAPETRVRLFPDVLLIVGFAMQPETMARHRGQAEAIERAGLTERLGLYLGEGWETLHETPASRVLLRGVQWAASPFLDAKRRAKLQLEPDRFLADSRVPAALWLVTFNRRLLRVGKRRLRG